MEVFDLISQAAPHPDISSLQGWLQVLSNLGFGGLAWYLIAFAMPKIQERFDAHADRQQAAFLAETARQQDAFLAETQRLRQSHESTIERIVEQHQRQQELLINSIRNTHTP